jgi:hypothetical protein
LVFLTAAIGAWIFHKITPTALRALHHLSAEPEAMPGGFRLYLNLQPRFWWMPVIVLAIGVFSWRFRFLRHSIALALLSSLVGLAFMAAALLLTTPLFMYAGLPSMTEHMAQELRAADQITLYSLEPVRTDTKAEGKFHGYQVYGHVKLSTREQLIPIIDAIIKGGENNRGSEALCFTPHHGLSVRSAGRKIDYSLCFQCNKLLYHPSGEYFHLNRSPRNLLNQVLRESGVTLAASEQPDDSDADKKQGSD